MAAWSDVLSHLAHRRRAALRVIVVIAVIALLIDGFLAERSLLHLLLLHPLLLLALFGALALTEQPEQLGTHDET